MAHEEFEILALDLMEATMNIATVHKVDLKRPVEDASFKTNDACIAHAFHHGMKTAFDAWSLLRKGPITSQVGNITILGGGCCYELPVLLHFLKDQHKEIHVKVIEPVARWKIFQPMHVRLAEKMGVRLKLDFVPVIDILEQIDSYKTGLLLAFNSLGTFSFGERKALRIAYATCNRHLIWHSSLSVMQDIFGASYIPARDEMEFFSELRGLNNLQIKSQRGFYLMHNIHQTSHVSPFKKAINSR